AKFCEQISHNPLNGFPRALWLGEIHPIIPSQGRTRYAPSPPPAASYFVPEPAQAAPESPSSLPAAQPYAGPTPTPATTPTHHWRPPAAPPVDPPDEA